MSSLNYYIPIDFEVLDSSKSVDYTMYVSTRIIDKSNVLKPTR